MSTIVETALGRFNKVAGPETPYFDRWLFECPGCGTWAYLDEDQWHGRVSVDHSGEVSPSTGAICEYHETHDYADVLERACNGNGPRAEKPPAEPDPSREQQEPQA